MNAREELNFGGPNFDVEDYNFVNIAAEYEINPHLSLFGRVDNLTGEHYSEVHELVFVGPKALDSGFPALGTALYGGMKLRFSGHVGGGIVAGDHVITLMMVLVLLSSPHL